MFELKEDSAFKQHLRDFLVQTKSFADKNNADLFAEEAAAQREVFMPTVLMINPVFRQMQQLLGQYLLYSVNSPGQNLTIQAGNTWVVP